MLLRSHCAGALDNEELFAIEGSENWRSTPGQTRRARNMTQKASKTPSPPPKPATLKAENLSLLQAGKSSNSGDELNLGHFHPHDHRDVHNLVELRHGHLSLHTACQRPCPELDDCNCGTSAVFPTPALGNWTGTTTSITLSMYCNGRISMELNRTMGICLCTTTEMSTTSTTGMSSDELNLRHFHCSKTPNTSLHYHRDVTTSPWSIPPHSTITAKQVPTPRTRLPPRVPILIVPHRRIWTE